MKSFKEYLALVESAKVEELEEGYKPEKGMVASLEKAFLALSKKVPASQGGLKIKVWKYRNPELGTGLTLGYTDNMTDKMAWSYCDNMICELESSNKPKTVIVRFFKEMKDVKDAKALSAKAQKAFTDIIGDMNEFVEGYSLKDRGTISDVNIDLNHFGE